MWIILFLLALYLGFEYYRSNYVLELEEITVMNSRLPTAFDGLKVVHLSDTHAKSFGENNEKLFAMVRAEAPDLIVLTGDIVERRKEYGYAQQLFEKLMEIADVYYVTGNHEWGAEWSAVKHGRTRFIPDLFALMDETGVARLDNKAVPVTREGETIWLAGLCDPNGPADSKSMGQVLEETEGGFSILLSHRYDLYGDYIAGDADVVFTGHGHGGLVRLPFTDGLIGPGQWFFPKHTGGLYQENGVSVIVSRGVGDTATPRFWNRPHVVSVTLQCG